MNNHKYTNRLIHEKSPYLLQHAHNPVDWHPWGEEAFETAKEKNKPILVSIGYATCHWCHVMERESFEDPKLAELLNECFLCVKVDREERPDVDSIYMKCIQALGQQGGWPLNIFMTPAGIPFYGGTYFPPVGRHGLPSFAQVIQFLNDTWSNEQDKIKKQGESLIGYLKENTQLETGRSPDSLSFEGEDRAAKLFADHYDHLNFGFKFQAQNKFPPSMGLSMLLRHHLRTGDGKSLEMTENTLHAMKNGGIYDQIGGGLSRYSTDYRWLVPHFEKMLYDNSLFITALVETYQVTGKDIYLDYAYDVLQYIDRDMTSPEHGFYSAEDADSEGVEGKFYVWAQGEIEDALERKTASIAIAYYNVTQPGNFEHRNILNVTRPLEVVAKEMALSEDTVREEIQNARTALLEYRSQRIRPLLDDKVLTSWNGLMISAMAKAGNAADDKDRIAKAEKAMGFIWTKLKTPEGKLLRRYREGEARYDGYLFDYTSIATACLDLYEACGDPKYIHMAKELMDTVDKKFASEGAYYETADDAEDLIVRQVSGYDGVEPSGNSNAVMALLRLAAYMQDTEYERKAEKIFSSFTDDLMEYGLNSSYMMQALHLYLGGLKEVAVIAPKNDPSFGGMRKILRKKLFPNAVFAFALEDDPRRNDIPLLADKKVIDGKPTAYVCQHGACLAPVTDVDGLLKLLADYP